ncbi:MAG: hypothetical protein N2C14_23615 [Planctomycetales bacterium]
MKTFIALSVTLVVAGWTCSSFGQDYNRETRKFEQAAPRNAAGSDRVIVVKVPRQQAVAAPSRHMNIHVQSPLVNREVAREMYIKNRGFYIKSRIQNLKTNAAYRQELIGPPPSRDQIIRMSKAGLPSRPAGDELEQYSGRIHWPEILQDDEYASYRGKITLQFLKRSQGKTGVGSRHFREVTREIENFQAVLCSNMGTMYHRDYVYCMGFLNRLGREASFSPDQNKLAG